MSVVDTGYLLKAVLTETLEPRDRQTRGLYKIYGLCTTLPQQIMESLESESGELSIEAKQDIVQAQLMEKSRRG
jgi:hypothetical protein